MKNTIWKYELQAEDINKIRMPKKAQILSVQTQKDSPCIWVLLNPDEKETEERFFEIFETGYNIPIDMGIERKFIGTFQLEKGTLVFHLFERIN